MTPLQATYTYIMTPNPSKVMKGMGVWEVHTTSKECKSTFQQPILEDDGAIASPHSNQKATCNLSLNNKLLNIWSLGNT